MQPVGSDNIFYFCRCREINCKNGRGLQTTIKEHNTINCICFQNRLKSAEDTKSKFQTCNNIKISIGIVCCKAC